MGLMFLGKRHEVKVLGNEYGHIVLQHLLLPQPLLLRSIKTTWAACSR